MQKAVVTGAAGFTGSILTEILREKDIEVYAIVRPGSRHNERLDRNDDGLHILEKDMESVSEIEKEIDVSCDVFFHLAWGGGRNNFEEQQRNISQTLDAVRCAKAIGCRKIVITGSQAEYGVVSPEVRQTERDKPEPFSAYGSAKTAACYLSRQLAKDIGIDWVWGRIFSLIGKNEPAGRMLPDLYHSLVSGQDFGLSSCRQNWDFLDVYDAAEALIALADRGKAGEIYNIANGKYRQLKEFTEELKRSVKTNANIIYGRDADPFVSLQPSVEKIRQDTGWYAKKDFLESVADYRDKES